MKLNPITFSCKLFPFVNSDARVIKTTIFSDKLIDSQQIISKSLSHNQY